MNEVNHKATTGPGPVLVTADQAFSNLYIKTSNNSISSAEKILNIKSCDKGLGGFMFSITMAMDCASGVPITIGSLLMPFSSAKMSA